MDAGQARKGVAGEGEGREPSWQAADVEQRVLENARVLWGRSVEQNWHDADDRANQLKNLSRLSVVVAAFSMSSFLEFNFDATTVSTGVLIVYGITTAAVAAIYMGCMAMCNLILATVLQLAGSYVTEEEESHFILHCREFAIRYGRGDRPPAPPRSFRRLWDFRCASSWRTTLIMFAAGVPVFLANLAVSGWIKFIKYPPGAGLMTGIVGLGLLYLAATILRWLLHLVKASKTKHRSPVQDGVKASRPLGLPWDWHMEPRVFAKTLEYSDRVSTLPGCCKANDEVLSGEEEVTRWREEDLEQQHLDNAMFLWTRYLQHLRTEVDERAEQLRSLSFLAGILLSFGMAALYQLVFSVPAAFHGLTIVYALTIALTVALNLCTMTACGFLNMGIVKTAASLAAEDEQALFLARCRAFARQSSPGARPPHPLRTFQSHWAARCERDWKLAFSTFTAGSAIFQMCLVISAWLKFFPQRSDLLADPPAVQHIEAAITMTVILGLGIAYFCYISVRWARGSKRLVPEERVKWGSYPPSVGLPFDWHLPPSRWDSSAATSRPITATAVPSALAVARCRSVPLVPSRESPYSSLRQDLGLQRSGGSGGRTNLSASRGWAAQSVEQRHLSNALALWKRFVDGNIADLEEREEQLQAVTEVAAVISGFMMIAFLQFQFDTTAVAPGLQLAYVATSGLTVTLMACSMTMCGIMLESLLESSSEFVNHAQEADFMRQCHAFCTGFAVGDRPPTPKKSFKGHWDARCESEWRRAFLMFSLGVPCFLANGAVSSWIKFQGNTTPAIIVTLLHGLAVLYLVASHARWFSHLFGSKHHPTLQGADRMLQPSGLPYDWHLPPKVGRSFVSL